MSLVNDMLRDLDGRLSTRGEDATLDGLRPAASTPRGGRSGWVASGILALGLLGAALWAWRGAALPDGQSPSAPVSGPPVAPTPAPAPTPASRPPAEPPSVPAATLVLEASPPPRAPAPAAVVERLTTHHGRDQTRLVLDLDRSVGYTVAHDEDRLRLTVEDARLGVPLPETLLDGPLIREAHSSQEGAVLVISLGLTRSVRVQSSLLRPMGGALPQLVLSLREDAPAEPAPATPRRAPETAPRATPRRLPVVKQAHRPSPAEVAEAAYAGALEAARHGELPAAIDALETLLERHGDHRGARESLATLLAGTGREVEARTVLHEGLERSPGHLPFLRLQARLLAGAGELDAAVGLLEQAVTGARDDAQLLALLAALYQRQGRHAESVRRYSEALALQPGQAPWWAGLAIGLEARGDAEQARQAYAAALERGSALVPNLRAYVAGRLAALGGAR